MTPGQHLGRRLANQGLTTPAPAVPEDVVRCLGAMQAQEFAAARWSIGLRSAGLTDQAVAKAFDEGRILRTHLLRPTWHFVTAGDLRWLLALTAPRVHAANAYWYRTNELDRDLFRRVRRVLMRALAGRRHLTRGEIGDALRARRIQAEGVRLAALLMHAELEAVICSGPRRGAGLTYALVEERVAPAPALSREEALATLVRRYFASHGPATARDFAWWSGLSARDVKAGIAMSVPRLEPRVRDGLTYWADPSTPPPPAARRRVAHLLPMYDEYLIAYKDRAEVLDAAKARSVFARGAGELGSHLVIGGRRAGSWRRVMRPDSVQLDVALYAPLSAGDAGAVRAAARRYGEFLGVAVTMTESRSHRDG